MHFLNGFGSLRGMLTNSKPSHRNRSDHHLAVEILESVNEAPVVDERRVVRQLRAAEHLHDVSELIVG